ncbi:MAG: hypothetical protein LLF94_06280, partial [Chlamydiales bacterium]|nr:hypothetical protein [Chlamydiales bacterium]
MIRILALFFLFFISSLKADVTIHTTGDKETLLINQTLAATVTLTYTQNEAPELFSFMYNLTKQPETSFRIVSSKIDPVKVTGNSRLQAIHFVLAPTRTGTLIFAPGIITFTQQHYLVPALKIDCESVGLSSLPLAGLLPLYPERRIDLSAANFMMIMNEKALQNAKLQNKETYQKYRLAWDTLALGILAVAFGLLLLWCIVYYELLARALKPLLVTETHMQKLLKELKKSDEIRPSLLSE